jgi:hypothetical protein
MTSMFRVNLVWVQWKNGFLTRVDVQLVSPFVGSSDLSDFGLRLIFASLVFSASFDCHRRQSRGRFSSYLFAPLKDFLCTKCSLADLVLSPPP